MNLPLQYQWLEAEPGPVMLVVALNYYGVAEIVGKKHNEMILNWAKELNLEWVFKDDETAWCGLYMAKVAKDAGKEIPADPFRALSWATFGMEVKQAMLGDILVFKRPGGNHVGLYVGEDVENYYHVLGGNQSNKVGFTRIDRDRCWAVRRPIWKLAPPDNLRPIYLTPKGQVSTNEA